MKDILFLAWQDLCLIGRIKEFSNRETRLELIRRVMMRREM